MVTLKRHLDAHTDQRLRSEPVMVGFPNGNVTFLFAIFPNRRMNR